MDGSERRRCRGCAGDRPHCRRGPAAPGAARDSCRGDGMRILVTRPQDAAHRTAGRLEALGHGVLVDSLLVLHYSPPEHLAGEERIDAVVITSANGARAVDGHPGVPRLAALPLWTVGSRTTEAARA